MAVVVTDEQRKNPALAGWVAAKDKENANAKPPTQQQIDYSAAANQFKANNWGPSGTANGLTESQNLANVYNSRGGPPVVPTEYIQGVLSQAKKDDTAGQPAAVSTGVTTESAPKGVVAGVANGGQQSPFDMIMAMYDNAYNSQSQKLKALRDTRLAGLAGQDTLINNQAQSGLNANDVSGARNSKALQESMANRGLGASGDFISAQIGQNTAQGENANNINLDKSQRLQGLQAEKDAINNNASADDLALLQQINSDRMNAQLGQYNSDRSFGLQEAGVTGSYNGMDTLQKSMEDRTFNYNAGQDQIQNDRNATNDSISNYGQKLANQLTEMKVGNYATEVKQAAALFEQEYKKGNLTNEALEYNLAELKNPKSALNMSKVYESEIKRLELAALPEMQRQELAKIRKTIADIGVPHYKPQTQAEIDYDKQQVIKIKAEIDKIKSDTNGKSLKGKEINVKESSDNYGMILEDVGAASDLAEAYTVIEQNVDNLTDADYKAAKAAARERFDRLKAEAEAAEKEKNKYAPK